MKKYLLSIMLLAFWSCEEEAEVLPEDCLGVEGGTALVDSCGVCDSDSTNDCLQDCAGVWGGNSVVDDCGICDSDSTNDCDGLVTNLDGAWIVTFKGPFENPDCSGDIDTMFWHYAGASLTYDLTVSNGTYTWSETNTWSNEDTTYSGNFTINTESGSICLDDDCFENVEWLTAGEKWSCTKLNAAKCNNDEDDTLPEYTTEDDCENAGHNWDDETCDQIIWGLQQ